LLVVSHPAVLAVNQLPYAELRGLGWDPFIVAPARWRHEYSAVAFAPEALPALAGRVAGRRVILPGRVQRHAYVTAIARLLAQVKPHAAFVEEEPTSVPAVQWGRALRHAGVPFGLQADENLDRPYPAPARAFRRWSLANAAFVAARSPSAAALLRRLHPRVPTPVIPHHVPAWPVVVPAARERFVVGYAGRLVAAKGLDVLIDATASVAGAELRLVGNGPLREALAARAAARGVALEIDTAVRHDDMAAAYSRFDVLVLPSRTTPTWAEQFGRALVEALWCGVPVVGSDSGEIPWVIESTGGGLVVPAGDVGALRQALVRLRDDPALRQELAARGRERAHERFGVQAVAAGLDDALRESVGLPARSREREPAGGDATDPAGVLLRDRGGELVAGAEGDP
jgi:glycosyltransferase involved in cell wall biosynthesis